MPTVAPNPKPADSPRFSTRLPRPLGTGFTAFVLLSAAVGLWFGLPIYRQQVAKDVLKHRGAYLESDYHGPTWLGSRPWGIDGRDEEWERNRLRKLFYNVTFVRLSSYRNGYGDFEFGDGDVRLLEAMPALRRVDLRDSNVTDAGLASLGSLVRLESLDLSGTKVSGQGLARIAHLPALRSISLEDVDLTDRDLALLTRFKSLKTLRLASSRMTDDGLKQIAAISTLERLELKYTNQTSITDAGIEHLKDMKSLRTVYFNTTGFTDAAINDLRSAVPGLRFLDVNDHELYEE